MPAAALKQKPTRKPLPTQSTAQHPCCSTCRTRPWRSGRCRPGRPREWYVTHNRRLKAMRLAIALLDSGVYLPNQARNETIRSTAETIGVHPPSDTTCHMVRALMRYSR